MPNSGDSIVCVDGGSRDGSAERIAGTVAQLIRHPINFGRARPSVSIA